MERRAFLASGILRVVRVGSHRRGERGERAGWRWRIRSAPRKEWKGRTSSRWSPGGTTTTTARKTQTRFEEEEKKEKKEEEEVEDEDEGQAKSGEQALLRLSSQSRTNSATANVKAKSTGDLVVTFSYPLYFFRSLKGNGRALTALPLPLIANLLDD